MKLSANTIGTLIFTAIATAAFVWMAKRPAVEATAINFGIPSQTTSATNSSAEPKVKEAQVDTPVVEEAEDTTINMTEETVEKIPEDISGAKTENPAEVEVPATTPTN